MRLRGQNVEGARELMGLWDPAWTYSGMAAAATLLGSERPFGQVRLLWQIFGVQERGGGQTER